MNLHCDRCVHNKFEEEIQKWTAKIVLCKEPARPRVRKMWEPTCNSTVALNGLVETVGSRSWIQKQAEHNEKWIVKTARIHLIHLKKITGY